MITNQKELRRQFWADHPGASRKLHKGDYATDTRCMFVDYIDHLERSGEITAALAQRATLK